MISKDNKAMKIGIVICIIFLMTSWVYTVGEINNNIFGLISMMLIIGIIAVDAYIYYHDKNRQVKILHLIHISLLVWIIYIVISRW